MPIAISGAAAGRSQRRAASSRGSGRLTQPSVGPPGAHVEEDPGAAAGDDRARVVGDHGEVAVRRRRARHVLAGRAERRRRAAADVAEAVVVRRAPGPRPTSRRRRPGGRGSGLPGCGATPYIVRRKPKIPVGVRRSPSCLAGEVPCCPSQAVQGPAVCRQQAPRFVHRRAASPACEARVRATTVISCVAEPVSSRPAKRRRAHGRALVVRRGRGGNGERRRGEGEQPHRPADYGGWPRSCSRCSRSRRRPSRTRSHG